MTELDSAHLEWLIESRAKNQRASLRLLQIIRSEGAALRGKSSNAAQALVSIAFSLWRAAFLADADIKGIEHADTFLEKLIVDNAIGYNQDRNSRNWTCPYYLNNAYFQLFQLARDVWPDLPMPQPTPGKAKEMWDKLHTTFLTAIDIFEKDLRASRKAK